jgi:nanoRNase/pAp phosphatase (c-di-AMP/oligoRNAs hydrolase)
MSVQESRPGEDVLVTPPEAGVQAGDAGSEPARPGVTAAFEAHRGGHHVVVLEDFPDADAISSAFAHQIISARFDIQVDIIYGGRITQQQNVALVKLLGIDLVRYGKDLALQQYDGAVFVDHQGTASDEVMAALESAHVPTVLVVDHREAREGLQAEFVDARRVGATATIYAQYLEQGLVQMDRSHTEHVLAATALMHGLMTSTDAFVRALAEDFRAAAFLSQFRDADRLEQILTQARSKQTMEIIRQALGNRIIVENYSIAGIGYLRIEDRDVIPQAADFLLTEENVHTAIVYGIVTGADRQEALTGAMKTSKITIDPGEFIRDVFGRDITGRYFGGDTPSAGGFEIPIGFLSGGQGEEYREHKWQVYDVQVKQRIFAKIGVEREASL